MPLVPVPGQEDIFRALRSVLLAILPPGTEVVKGQANKVPEPQAPNYVIATTLRRERIATNVVVYDDCAFTGSISGTTLSVTAFRLGTLAVGRSVFGTGASVAPIVTALAGPFSATLSSPLTLPPSPLAAGAQILTQKTRVVLQIDVHAPDMSISADMAQTISTILRDPVGGQLFAASNLPITPLFADDPKQVPFVNAAGQYESRHVVECHLQADQILSPTQEFADTVAIDRVAADLFFHA